MYTDGKKIREILDATGIAGSTLYLLLKQHKVPLRPPKHSEKISISFDQEAMSIISKVHPDNLSAWICGLIKQEKS